MIIHRDSSSPHTLNYYYQCSEVHVNYQVWYENLYMYVWYDSGKNRRERVRVSHCLSMYDLKMIDRKYTDIKMY